MKVEIWSDVVCPWCYIGKRRFEEALARFPGRDDVRGSYRAFQLDPTAPPGVARPVSEVYERKFGSAEHAASLVDHVTRIAADSGLDFHLEHAVRSNTLLAHRLLWLAEQRGVQDAVQERLLRAYFCEGRNVGDPDALAELAADVGLDADEVRAYLDSDAGRPEVEEQLRRAVELGMTAVPTYLFDDDVGRSRRAGPGGLPTGAGTGGRARGGRCALSRRPRALLVSVPYELRGDHHLRRPGTTRRPGPRAVCPSPRWCSASAPSCSGGSSVSGSCSAPWLSCSV